MKNNSEFTVSIRGRGRLLGLVVSAGMDAFPKSVWYDYSQAMKNGVAQERRIADSGRMTPEGVNSVRIAVANQAAPRRTDFNLDFSSVGAIDTARIEAGKTTRLFVLNERTSPLADPYPMTVQQIVRTIGQMANALRPQARASSATSG